MTAEMNDGAALRSSEPRLRTWDWIAVALLVFGPFLLVFGWVAGVFLLWTSNRWNTVWKIIGTAAWPISWAAAAGCDALGARLWLSLLVAAVIEFAVYVALIKEARV